jgi:hypothetical protein
MMSCEVGGMITRNWQEDVFYRYRSLIDIDSGSVFTVSRLPASAYTCFSNLPLDFKTQWDDSLGWDIVAL